MFVFVNSSKLFVLFCFSSSFNLDRVIRYGNFMYHLQTVMFVTAQFLRSACCEYKNSSPAPCLLVVQDCCVICRGSKQGSMSDPGISSDVQGPPPGIDLCVFLFDILQLNGSDLMSVRLCQAVYCAFVTCTVIIKIV